MRVWIAFLLVGSCGVCSVAQSQDALVGNQDLLPQKAVSVLNRPRPEYDPLGISFGALRLSPDLTLTQAYDDNIYATRTNVVGDGVSTVAGTLGLDSRGQSPAITASGGFSSTNYLHHHMEDYLDFNGEAAAGFAFGTLATLNTSGEFSRAHLARQDTSFPHDALEPPSFDTLTGVMNVAHDSLRGNLDLNLQVVSYDYHDALLPGGVLLSQNFKNHDELTFDLRSSYLLNHTVSAFLRVIHKQYDYRQDTAPGALDRDATADTVGGGASFEITNLMTGELGVGYLHLRTHQLVDGTQSTFSLRSNIDFYLTQLITATLTAERITGAADIAGSSTFISTNGTLALNYELRRNVILTASYTAEHRQYTGIDASETSEAGALKARWLVNRSLKFDLAYNLERRRTPFQAELGEDYNQNIVELEAELAL